MQKLILALSGSSGSIYAHRLMTKLSKRTDVQVSVVYSVNALTNWKIEIGEFKESEWPFKFYDRKDFFAPFASGSSKHDIMIICPCSMGQVGKIASGISSDLTGRAADVILKERRRLILVPRETPLNLIHLRNMSTITEAGGVICYASPSFYSSPSTKEEIVDTVVDRVLDLAGLDNDSYRWGD